MGQGAQLAGALQGGAVTPASCPVCRARAVGARLQQGLPGIAGGGERGGHVREHGETPASGGPGGEEATATRRQEGQDFAGRSLRRAAGGQDGGGVAAARAVILAGLAHQVPLAAPPASGPGTTPSSARRAAASAR